MLLYLKDKDEFKMDNGCGCTGCLALFLSFFAFMFVLKFGFAVLVLIAVILILFRGSSFIQNILSSLKRKKVYVSRPGKVYKECTYCGKKTERSANYCDNCGKPFEQE